MQEARNIAKVQELQTPLLPRQNFDLEEGITTKGLTPLISSNTPMRQTPISGSITPFGGNSTPFGKLGDKAEEWDENKKESLKISREELKMKLQNLPAPQ